MSPIENARKNLWVNENQTQLKYFTQGKKTQKKKKKNLCVYRIVSHTVYCHHQPFNLSHSHTKQSLSLSLSLSHNQYKIEIRFQLSIIMHYLKLKYLKLLINFHVFC